MTIRTAFLDPDHHASHSAKTNVWCCRCGKDIRGKYRMVHLIGGGMTVLHPADEAIYVADGGDCGGYPIGPDCARKLGLEWSHAAD